MGYDTRYDGKIRLVSEQGRRLVQVLVQKNKQGAEDEDGTGADFGRNLFESNFDEKKGILTIDEERKNYEGEMEEIFALIAFFDKEAEGEILSEGEDGEDKCKFTISKGKVFEEEGYVAYKNRKEISKDYDFDDVDDEEMLELKEQIAKFSKPIKCEKCGGVIDLSAFNFSRRGYYERIKKETGWENLDEKCYRTLKKDFLEMDALAVKSKELFEKIRKKREA